MNQARRRPQPYATGVSNVPSNNLFRFEGRSLDPPLRILGAAFTFVIQSELTLIQRSAVTEEKNANCFSWTWKDGQQPSLATS